MSASGELEVPAITVADVALGSFGGDIKIDYIAQYYELDEVERDGRTIMQYVDYVYEQKLINMREYFVLRRKATTSHVNKVRIDLVAEKPLLKLTVSGQEETRATKTAKAGYIKGKQYAMSKSPEFERYINHVAAYKVKNMMSSCGITASMVDDVTQRLEVPAPPYMLRSMEPMQLLTGALAPAQRVNFVPTMEQFFDMLTYTSLDYSKDHVNVPVINAAFLTKQYIKPATLMEAGMGLALVVEKSSEPTVYQRITGLSQWRITFRTKVAKRHTRATLEKAKHWAMLKLGLVDVSTDRKSGSIVEDLSTKHLIDGPDVSIEKRVRDKMKFTIDQVLTVMGMERAMLHTQFLRRSLVEQKNIDASNTIIAVDKFKNIPCCSEKRSKVHPGHLSIIYGSGFVTSNLVTNVIAKQKTGTVVLVDPILENSKNEYSGVMLYTCSQTAEQFILENPNLVAAACSVYSDITLRNTNSISSTNDYRYTNSQTTLIALAHQKTRLKFLLFGIAHGLLLQQPVDQLWQNRAHNQEFYAISTSAEPKYIIKELLKPLFWNKMNHLNIRMSAAALGQFAVFGKYDIDAPRTAILSPRAAFYIPYSKTTHVKRLIMDSKRIVGIDEAIQGQVPADIMTKFRRLDEQGRQDYVKTLPRRIQFDLMLYDTMFEGKLMTSAMRANMGQRYGTVNLRNKTQLNRAIHHEEYTGASAMEDGDIRLNPINESSTIIDPQVVARHQQNLTIYLPSWNDEEILF